MKKYFLKLIVLLFPILKICSNEIEKQSDSCIFIKEYRDQKLSLNFPSKFNLEYIDVDGLEKAMQLQTIDKNVNYIFLAYPNNNDFLNKNLDLLKSSKYIKITNFEKIEKEEELIYNIVYEDKFSGINNFNICKSKIIATKKNIYILFAIKQKDQEDNFEEIVSTFVYE
ncbi:MAG: hypothetical protein K1060chlam5_00819 [Candidatus Anoxychlamydiales bacterium]|nr:hypothetical protein [Candidatus Anoxychlamydiales bacterium]